MEDQVLFCALRKRQDLPLALGKRTANGFVVPKGSQAVKEHRASSVRTAARREQYAEQGLLTDSGNCYVFSKDYEFSSPSAAGAIVRGAATNSLTSWKNEDGVQLKDLD